MPERHEYHEGTPRKWLEFAQADLAAAASLRGTTPTLRAIAAFHAQQAAEKALKGYLVFREVRFPYTHSINALRELAFSHAPWVQKLEAADGLTPFATTARYPGIGREVSDEMS
jgi:HEPN domain-containing protein